MIKSFTWVVMVSVVMLWGLVGCGGQATPPSITITSTPPPYVEPFSPITRDNLEQIRLLGNLITPQQQTSTVFAHAFSIDDVFLGGLNNDLLLVWNTLTGEVVFMTSRSDAQQVYFSPNKVDLYTLDSEGTLNTYTVDSGDLTNSTRVHERYNGVGAYYAPDGILATAGTDDVIRVWNLVEERALVALNTNVSLINNVVFSTDGALLAVAGEAQRVEVWDWQTRQRVSDVVFDDVPEVTRIAFDPSNRYLAISTQNNIRIATLADGTVPLAFSITENVTNDLLAYSGDGNALMGIGYADAMNVWNPLSGALVAAIPDLGGEPTRTAFSPDHSLMLSAVFQGETAIWDIATLTSGTVAQYNLNIEASIVDVAWSADGRTLALFEPSGTIQVWGIPDPNQELDTY